MTSEHAACISVVSREWKSKVCLVAGTPIRAAKGEDHFQVSRIQSQSPGKQWRKLWRHVSSFQLCLVIHSKAKENFFFHKSRHIECNIVSASYLYRLMDTLRLMWSISGRPPSLPRTLPVIHFRLGWADLGVQAN